MSDHQMVTKTIKGYKPYQQCDKCGCTQHSGYWWLAGYQSKETPPCNIWENGDKLITWRENAKIAQWPKEFEDE